jgi:hypothetical protein
MISWASLLRYVQFEYQWFIYFGFFLFLLILFFYYYIIGEYIWMAICYKRTRRDWIWRRDLSWEDSIACWVSI